MTKWNEVNQVIALSNAHYREHKFLSQIVFLLIKKVNIEARSWCTTSFLFFLYICSMNFRLSTTFVHINFSSIERKKNCHRFYIAWEMKSEFLSLQFHLAKIIVDDVALCSIVLQKKHFPSLLHFYYWVKNVAALTHSRKEK